MCPYVENADARCAAHLTLRNIFSAFEHCVDQYSCCRIYQDLLGKNAYVDMSKKQLAAAS